MRNSKHATYAHLQKYEIAEYARPDSFHPSPSFVRVSVCALLVCLSAQPEDSAEWFSTVEWSCGTEPPSGMLEQVGSTLAALGILDSAPDPATLWAKL